MQVARRLFQIGKILHFESIAGFLKHSELNIRNVKNEINGDYDHIQSPLVHSHQCYYPFIVM